MVAWLLLAVLTGETMEKIYPEISQIMVLTFVSLPGMCTCGTLTVRSWCTNCLGIWEVSMMSTSTGADRNYLNNMKSNAFEGAFEFPSLNIWSTFRSCSVAIVFSVEPIILSVGSDKNIYLGEFEP